MHGDYKGSFPILLVAVISRTLKKARVSWFASINAKKLGYESTGVVNEYIFTTANKSCRMVSMKIKGWKARGVILVDFQTCAACIRACRKNLIANGLVLPRNRRQLQTCLSHYVNTRETHLVGIATSSSKLGPCSELFSPAWIPKEMPRMSAFQPRWRS